VVNEITGKTTPTDKLILKHNRKEVEDPKQVSEILASYFQKKVENLCSKTGLKIPIPVPHINPPLIHHNITDEEIERALKKMKRKK